MAQQGGSRKGLGVSQEQGNGAGGGDWPLRLFKKSVIKQRKFAMLREFVGPTRGLKCLDIGSDNGIYSLLLRKRGGEWTSADLEEGSVESIRGLVGTRVFRIDGGRTPFQDDEFDLVAVIDFLEHIPSDREFVDELSRILRPGGTLVVNVPNDKRSPLRRFRLMIGQTDEKHGHLRPGYTVETLSRLLGGRFAVERAATYSKSFSEVVDTLIVGAVYALKGHREGDSKKGAIVTGKDMSNYGAMFKVYSLIYPVMWLMSKLDGLLFFTSGYMLIARTKSNKPAVEAAGAGAEQGSKKTGVAR